MVKAAVFKNARMVNLESLAGKGLLIALYIRIEAPPTSISACRKYLGTADIRLLPTIVWRQLPPSMQQHFGLTSTAPSFYAMPCHRFDKTIQTD